MKKNVGIFGAGIFGLYTAIKLKLKNVKNVTVFDPYHGIYTKSGPINPSVFKDVSVHLAAEAKVHLNKEISDEKSENNSRPDIANLNLVMTSSRADHIKDLERQLYNTAVSLGVHFERASFSRFSEHGVVTVGDDKRENPTPKHFDYLFDATGTKRAVVNEVNRLIGEKSPLQVKSVAKVTNHSKNHFYAYVNLNLDDADLFKQDAEANISNLQHIVHLEHLRDKFNWPHFSDPYFRIIPVSPLKENEEKENMGKFHLYFEIPPDLKPDQYENWLRAILELKSGKNIDFKHVASSKKYAKKPRFGPFEVNPEKIESAGFAGNETIPMVIPIGDAQYSGYYRTGDNVPNGILRANAVIDQIEISNGEITNIHLDRCDRALIEMMHEQSAQINQYFINRREQLISELEREKDNYSEMLAELEGNSIEAHDSHLAQMLNLMEKQFLAYSIELHAEAQADLQSIVKTENGLTFDEDTLKGIEPKLIQAMELLSHISSTSTDTQANTIEDRLFALAKIYQLIAEDYAKKNSFEKAKEYLSNAMTIYRNYFPQQKMDLFVIHLRLVENAVELKDAEINYLITNTSNLLDEIANTSKLSNRDFSYLLQVFNKTFLSSSRFEEAQPLIDEMRGKIVQLIFDKINYALAQLPCDLESINSFNAVAKKQLEMISKNAFLPQDKKDSLLRQSAKIDNKIANAANIKLAGKSNLYPEETPTNTLATSGAKVGKDYKL